MIQLWCNKILRSIERIIGGYIVNLMPVHGGVAPQGLAAVLLAAAERKRDKSQSTQRTKAIASTNFAMPIAQSLDIALGLDIAMLIAHGLDVAITTVSG